MDTISSRINMVISAKGIKKTEFARRLKISDSSVSTMCSGKSNPSNQTISMICYEFGVNEAWLRTGEGEMFIPKSRSDEIAAFVGDILKGEPDFRQKFISVLARMTPDEWKILEKKALELAEEIKKG